jgi:hypothetical protein
LLDFVQNIPQHFKKPVSLFADVKWWVAAAAGRLVIAATELGDAEAACWLCKRREAQQMNPGSIAQVLQWAIAQQEWKQQDGQPGDRLKLLQQVLRAVVVLPSARALFQWPDLVLVVLREAVQQQLPQQLVTMLVRELQAVKCLNFDTAAELLQLAQQQGATGSVTVFEQLLSVAVVCLLQLAPVGQS